MTTVLRTRIPLETLSMSQPTARRRSKRLAAYDEEDGDFMFTRGSKRTKTAPAEPEPVPAPPVVAPHAKRGRKPKEPKSKEPPERDEETVSTAKMPKRRKMSFSTPKVPSETISNPRRRKSTRSSTGKAQNGETSYHASRAEPADEDSMHILEAPNETQHTEHQTEEESGKHSTVISLPFSDTPIINRNKELRKKGGNSSRRSSSGLRGRRASSLIDNGHSAIPHREVETSEFYRHIESEGLSEPRRMKQVLTWTGERCMGDKVSHGDPDSAAKLAARMVKESLLKDFANKSEFSDWFNREDSAPTKIIKTPNPRNIELERNLVDLEARVKLLREERTQWKTLSKPPPLLPPLLPDSATEIQTTYIDASLLDPEQATILQNLTSLSAHQTRKNTAENLKTLQHNLELKVDLFRDGIHKLERYQDTVGKIADRILETGGRRMEARDEREKESVGTRDLPMMEVLRSLSRILPDGGRR